MAPRTPPFTTAERNLLRAELMVRFGQPPNIADGIALRTWHSGPQAGTPKIPKAVSSMLERGLVEIGPGIYGRPCARFTAIGLEALRALANDRRALDPECYAHVRRELGMDAGDSAGAE